MMTFLSTNDLSARPLAVKKEQIEKLANNYLTATKEKIIVEKQIVDQPLENISEQVSSQVETSIEQSVAEVTPDASVQPVVEKTPVTPIVDVNFQQSVPVNANPTPPVEENIFSATPVIQTQPVNNDVPVASIPIEITPVKEPVVVEDPNAKLVEKIKQAYVVEKGDTVESICQTFGYNVPSFRAYNKLTVTTTIMPGMILFFPFSEGSYTKVDEIYYDRLSKKLVKLAKMNKLSDNDALAGLNNSGELTVASEPNIFG